MSRFKRTVGSDLLTEIGDKDPAVRQAVIHAFARSITTVWIVMTPLCGVCLVLGAPRISVASLNVGTDPGHLCISTVLFIRHYSMKRTIIQEGRKNSGVGTPASAVTLVTQAVSNDPPGTPQTVEEKRESSASDLEKGLSGSDDGNADERGEKDEIEEEYVKKG